jgi:hypothetical protein
MVPEYTPMQPTLVKQPFHHPPARVLFAEP